MEQESRRPAEATASSFHRTDDAESLNPNAPGAQAIATIEADPIGHFMPGAGPDERALRKRLRNAWTISSARASRSNSDTARAFWWQVSLAASEWTFARRSNADLKDIADALARVFLAANTFERIEGSAE